MQKAEPSTPKMKRVTSTALLMEIGSARFESGYVSAAMVSDSKSDKLASIGVSKGWE